MCEWRGDNLVRGNRVRVGVFGSVMGDGGET